MSEIAQTIENLRAESVNDLIKQLNPILIRMQQEIWQLRQFLEPAVKHNENCPNQQFNPLE